MLLALFLLAGITLPGSIFAQGRVDKYTITSIAQTFTNIGGTQFVTGGDDNGGTTTLPFDFNYDDKIFSAGSVVRACCNGWLDFNGAQPYGSPYVDRVLNTSYNYTKSIYIASADMNTVSGVF